MADISKITVGSSTYDVKDANALPKLTYEWNKSINFGNTGKLCIGKFPCYDSNITIYIDATTSTTYHGTLVIATQNINTTGGGTISATVYGDLSRTLASSLYIDYNSGSQAIGVYFSPQAWSKNVIHIKASALSANASDICTSITSIPSTATRRPANDAYTLTSSGSGNAVTSISLSGTEITVAKGSTFSLSNHTHSYAGSSSAGGAATSANKLNTDKGSATNPVYFSGGVPVACTYSLNKTVPSDAVFTDTTYESKAAASGGTAVSLVTTGEKYTWNNKSNLTIGTTATTAAAGNHTHNTVVDSGDSTKTVSFGYSKADYGDASYIAVWNSNELRTLSKGSVCSLIDASPVGHTHNYAGLASGQSAGGKAASAAVADSANAVAWANVSGKPSFATVATSGSYNDLSNKPTIPAAQVQTDWNATSGMGVLLNKPSSLPASDVYSWAKQSIKPSYAHNEISPGDLTIGDGANRLYFRTNATWRAGVYYHTTANEALVFGNKNANTSWIFATTDPNSRADWTGLTPSLQVKNQRVTINKLIASGTDASYNLDVNGTANATTLYENGTALSSKYQAAGSYVPTTRTVNNKALSADISLTYSDVGAAAASHGNHVPATQTASNSVFLRNDNTWQTVTPANIGAAASVHAHTINFGSAGTHSTDYALEADTRYEFTAGGSSCIIQTPPNTVTTATTTGSGNAVTSITASNGALTVTKGSTFLTSHQDISGKADKASITAGTAGTSSATSGSTLAVPYVTMNAQGIVTGYGTHTHTITGFSTTDTKNTAGTTSKTATKMFLVGATSQAANPQTYSNANCYIGTDNKLYSGGERVLTTSQATGLSWTRLAQASSWSSDKSNWQPYSSYSQYDYLVFMVGNSYFKSQVWVKTSQINDDGDLRITWTDYGQPSSSQVYMYVRYLAWETSVVSGHTHGGDLSDLSTNGYSASIVLKAGTPTYSRTTITYTSYISEIYGVKQI